MKKTTNGFTLVELLIAIVVIAILASISVVAYSGIQHRANASKAAAVVDSYAKLLKMYYVDHQRFPDPGEGVYGSGDWCLGEVEDFAAVSASFNQGDCLYNSNPASAGSGDGHYRVGAYQDFNDSLAEYAASNLPAGDLQVVKLGNESWRGVRYSPFYNGQFVRLEWILSGDVEDQCAQANYASDGWWGSTWCTLDIDMR